MILEKKSHILAITGVTAGTGNAILIAVLARIGISIETFVIMAVLLMLSISIFVYCLLYLLAKQIILRKHSSELERIGTNLAKQFFDLYLSNSKVKQFIEEGKIVDAIKLVRSSISNGREMVVEVASECIQEYLESGQFATST